MTAITTANVFEAFDEAADSYDLMVGLNPGYHATCDRPPRPGRAAAGPSGAAARARCGWPISAAARARPPGPCCVPRTPPATAHRGRRRRVGRHAGPGPGQVLAAGGQLRDRHGRGAGLRPGGLGSAGQVPGVFAAYLFRNVTERDKVLAAVFDLLADDGTFVVQEYSVAGLAAGHG